MSFDMYLGDRHEYIDDSEELLFQFVNAQFESSGAYPELYRVWELFYDSPRITPAQSVALVVELRQLNRACNDDARYRSACGVIERLIPFFDQAQRDESSIRCVSD